MVEKAVLEYGDCRVSLPVLHGTDGSPLVDVTSLYKDHKILTYDPGFMSTAACKSEITFIDGDEGILRYRGIDVDDLVGIEGGYCTVVYLLLYGVRPLGSEIERFARAVGREYPIPETVVSLIESFPKEAHPMAILGASFAALAAHYHRSQSVSQIQSVILAVAKVPGILATIYRHSKNLKFIRPDTDLEYTQNFIKMMFGDMESLHRDTICDALSAILIMHADHEQNASTATVRMAGSSGAELFACLSAGVATLWGPAHGGANEAVIKMLEDIGSPEKVNEFIGEVKDGKNGIRLMGFGHRVYKNYDPRAKVMRSICHNLLRALGREDRLLDIAIALEEVALRDEYFIERKLYPNVDFYSGIVLRAMGIPENMFTTIFALGRTSGWAAQWYEMVQDSDGLKIGRPRQLYMGR